MPRNPFSLIPAAQGQDATTDPPYLPPTRAQAINNLLPDRTGRLRAVVRVVDCIATPFVANIDGEVWHSGTFNVFDRLLVVSDGSLWETTWGSLDPDTDLPLPGSVLGQDVVNVVAGTETYLAPYPPLFYPFIQTTPSNSPFKVGVTVRGLQWATQTLLMAGGSANNWQYVPDESAAFTGAALLESALNPGTLYTLGLTAPIGNFIGTPGIDFYTTYSTTGSSQKTPYFPYTVAVTWIDGFGNESNAGFFKNTTPLVGSPPFSIITTINFPLGADTLNENIVGANVYVNTQANPGTFYLVANLNPLNGLNNVYTDDASDADVALATQLAPHPGENDAPNPASFAITYQNHVVLNDLTVPNGAQISNLDSATQFATVATVPQTATDGIRPVFGNDVGNPVTAFAIFGTNLLVFLRRTIWILQGDNATNFYWAQMDTAHGAVSTDAVIQCANIVVFLSDDGIYQVVPSYGVLRMGGTDIDANLDYYRSTPAGQALLSQARAWYDGRRYGIVIGTDQFVWDFEVQGWVTVGAGSGYGNALTNGVTFGPQVVP